MKTQNEMRGEFEKLEEICDLMKTDDLFFNEVYEVYGSKSNNDFDAGYVNGAWYIFQEQQKKIDKIVSLVWSETPDYDLDNKIKELLK